MKFIIITAFLLMGCETLQQMTPGQKTLGGGLTGGIAIEKAKEAYKKHFVQYEKKLNLPALQVCFVPDEDEEVEEAEGYVPHLVCELNSCEEEDVSLCQIDLGPAKDVVADYLTDLFFIPRTGFYDLASKLETYCYYKEDSGFVIPKEPCVQDIVN